MFKRFLSALIVLLGLLLGAALSLPLAWSAARRGADSQRDRVLKALEAVQQRQSSMVDQGLRWQAQLAGRGWRRDGAVYASLVDLRGRLAGEDSLEERLLLVQHLEEPLLRAAAARERGAAAEPELARSEEWQSEGRAWEQQQRYLVREQAALQENVERLNAYRGRWPISTLLACPRMRDAWRALALAGLRRPAAWLRPAEAAEEGLRRLPAALAAGLDKFAERAGDLPWWDPAGLPAAQRPEAGWSYLPPLGRLVFLADAPLPEDELPELQYDRSSRDAAQQERGEQKVEPDNRRGRHGYKIVSPTPQKSVDYSQPD